MPRFLPKLATRHRLVGLAAVSIGLSLATAALGYGAAGALADALRRATAASSAAYDFMLGDMMHDALHADVLIALRTGSNAAPEAKQAAATNLKEHAATFRAVLAALRKLELDEELRRAIAGVEKPIEAYIAQAEEIAALASEDVAAAEARYPSFFATFESLEAANGRVGELIDARSAAIGAAGEARTARAQTTLVLFSLGTIVLVAAGAVAVGLSIARRDASEARMRHMAFHDALTGLPNRTLFRERLGEALSRMRRTNESVAVLCLDLDRFKDVNDALGHPAGDLLLKEVAARLKGCVRESDTVARLGGDEFAILQLGVGQPEGVSALAQRLLHVLEEPIDLDGHRTVSAGSIGVAIAPTDGEVPDELIRNADIALYRAKGDGRGVFRFFEAEMDARLQARRRLEHDLREALSAGRFELHYQPQVEPASGRLTGFEALLRWRDPDRGMVPPSEFIPLAEETGLILPLGEWVLRRACADAAAWPASLRVAVNLSPVQFRRGDIVELVSTVLQDIRLAPDRLELEITEGTLLHDTAAILTALDGLRAMGVRIAMDDFGTGYSSLSYLRRFPFDKIKIDRSFVQALDGREDNAAVVRAIIGLGRSLGMATTAEGVETEDQLAVLRAEGCDEVQGYLLGRPQPLGTVEAMMALEGRADSRPRPVASGRLAPA